MTELHPDGREQGRNWILATSAALGLSGVGLGAFGAHALEAMLEASERGATWETAVLYQLVHAVALLALAGLRAAPAAQWKAWVFRLWVAGSLIFSGSLYILCLTGITWLGAITPIGGLALLAGWGILLWQSIARA